MTSLMRHLLDPQFVVMALAAVAVFATITSFVLPLLSGDRLDSRMKYVAGERERLRAEHMARLAEALGLSRSGLYRFISFENLPDFIKKELDLKPGLIGGHTADDVVSVLKKHGEAGLKAARELWPQVVEGELSQGRFASAIVSLATKPKSGNVT